MKKYNCPNCGAPIGYSNRCQYCGTVLDWTPHIAGTIVYTSLPVDQLVAEVCIPEIVAKDFEEDFLIDALAKQFLPQVKERMEIRTELRIDTLERCYRARVFMTRRPDKYISFDGQRAIAWREEF